MSRIRQLSTMVFRSDFPFPPRPLPYPPMMISLFILKGYSGIPQPALKFGQHYSVETFSKRIRRFALFESQLIGCSMNARGLPLT
jgi:hypothetical protein